MTNNNDNLYKKRLNQIGENGSQELGDAMKSLVNLTSLHLDFR